MDKQIKNILKKPCVIIAQS